MNNFLIDYKNTITFSVEILAALTGLVFYKKYKLTAAKYFIYFLVGVAVFDIFSSYVNYIKDGFLAFLEGTVLVRNFWWTTIYWEIGAIAFFAFYYNRILIREKFKRIVRYSSYIFITFSIGYILLNWDEYFIRFFPIIGVLGAIIIFICAVFYFYEILTSDKILTFFKSLNFYISAAIFIWWLITTPLIFYDIYNTHFDRNYLFLKWQIFLFANVAMYLTFTFALIFCEPQIDNGQ